MKKALIVLLVVGLVTSALVAPAAAKKKKKKAPPEPVRIERVVEFEYQCPCGVDGVGGWQFGEATGENIGGGPVPIVADDVFVKASVSDMSGTPVIVALQNDENGDGFNDPMVDFCGEMEASEPVRQTEGVVRVFISSGLCGSSPAIAAGGTVTLTFSNLP